MLRMRAFLLLCLAETSSTGRVQLRLTQGSLTNVALDASTVNDAQGLHDVIEPSRAMDVGDKVQRRDGDRHDTVEGEYLGRIQANLNRHRKLHRATPLRPVKAVYPGRNASSR